MGIAIDESMIGYKPGKNSKEKAAAAGRPIHCTVYSPQTTSKWLITLSGVIICFEVIIVKKVK